MRDSETQTETSPSTRKHPRVKIQTKRAKGLGGQEPIKYYKRFEYSYKRDCFRAMTEYLKLLFKPYRTGWKRRANTKPIIEYLSEFIQECMPGLTEFLNEAG